ncbi:hypothetical protein V3C99_010300, partial [Haemonchus contortus]
ACSIKYCQSLKVETRNVVQTGTEGKHEEISLVSLDPLRCFKGASPIKPRWDIFMKDSNTLVVYPWQHTAGTYQCFGTKPDTDIMYEVNVLNSDFFPSDRKEAYCTDYKEENGETVQDRVDGYLPYKCLINPSKTSVEVDCEICYLKEELQEILSYYSYKVVNMITNEIHAGNSFEILPGPTDHPSKIRFLVIGLEPGTWYMMYLTMSREDAPEDKETDEYFFSTDYSQDETSRRPRSTPEKMEFQYVTTTSFAIAFELVVGDAELDPIEGYEFHLYDNSDHNAPIIEEIIPLDRLMTRGGKGIIQAYGLESGTTYTASVRCYNKFGSAAVGINGTLTTLKQLPKYSYQDQELSLISISHNEIKVSWTEACADCQGYKVSITSANVSRSHVLSKVRTAYRFSRLTPSTRYTISVNPIPGRFMVLTCATLDKNHESLYKDITHKRQTVAEIKEQVKHLEEAVEKRKLLKRDLLMQRDLLERRVSILKRELEIRFERIAEVNQVNMLKTVFIVCELLVIIILSALLAEESFVGQNHQTGSKEPRTEERREKSQGKIRNCIVSRTLKAKTKSCSVIIYYFEQLCLFCFCMDKPFFVASPIPCYQNR